MNAEHNLEPKDNATCCWIRARGQEMKDDSWVFGLSNLVANVWDEEIGWGGGVEGN